jgi:hypothetical protein
VTGIILAAALLISSASAEEPTPQPYIDQLRRDLRPDQESAESYTEKLRRKNAEKQPQQESSESYTESLRKTLPPTQGQPSSFIGSEKDKIPAKSEGGAIQAVKDGTSDLKALKEGEIHHAAGFRLSAASSRTVTGGGGSASGDFYTYYERGWVPELSFFYEYQPIHSEIFGNIGLIAGAGFTYQKGTGVFRIPVTNPFTGTTFGTTSRTTLRFITLPVSLGVNYRLNLLHYLRPYVQASAVVVGYTELRSDGREDLRGRSTGFQFSGGANILLDSLFKKASWNLYESYTVKHYYLTVDYTKLATVAGDIDFDASTMSVGFTYEF